MNPKTGRHCLNLDRAVVVCSEDAPWPERKALQTLVEEVRKRTRIAWGVTHTMPEKPTPTVLVASISSVDSLLPRSGLDVKPRKQKSEGFRICVTAEGDNPPLVTVVGADSRGVLFGCGRLLRELVMELDRIRLSASLDIDTAPCIPLRGHQLGYRPKTNSYCAWDVPMWEQYIRDLAVFGTNAIELIPPRSDDEPDSPHLPLPQMEMMVRMSQLVDDYGLDVWIWYPAMDEDYSDAETVKFALKEWGEVFQKLPRVDAVLVPGGDPGHTRPNHMFPFLEKQAANLRRFHPEAQMWMSPQSFNQEWMDEFVEIVNRQKPEWLAGVVFGPESRLSLSELRKVVPDRYPIRHYPDITHSERCQYPVADWDVAYGITEQREVINPRPNAMSRIFHHGREETVGFLTYSEGCNDDLNKIVWSCLGWDPEARVGDILREYSRYFIGERYREGFAQGLLALERNWQGPLLTNTKVAATLRQFQSMERSGDPKVLLNWRFQQALYRAYYDEYQRRRLIHETEIEESAMDVLRRAKEIGSPKAMERAESLLDRAVLERVAPDLRARVFELAEALYQSIRMQLSVPRYGAIHVDRGANLDLVDVPLNNREWLQKEFARIRGLDDEEERLWEMEAVVNWTNPGAGGFYDDLGNLSQQPHLVPGKGAEEDPEFRETPLVGFCHRPGWRLSWRRHAESRYDAPLQLRYPDLVPAGRYRVRAVYAGDNRDAKIRLVANGGIEIHPYLPKEDPPRPFEFEIPPEATMKGELTLSWFQESGKGGAGRGCQVAEVWLEREEPGGG